MRRKLPLLSDVQGTSRKAMKAYRALIRVIHCKQLLRIRESNKRPQEVFPWMFDLQYDLISSAILRFNNSVPKKV